MLVVNGDVVHLMIRRRRTNVRLSRQPGNPARHRLGISAVSLAKAGGQPRLFDLPDVDVDDRSKEDRRQQERWRAPDQGDGQQQETHAGIDRFAQVSEWTACHEATGPMPDGPRGSAFPDKHRHRPRDRCGPQNQERPEQRGQGKNEGPKRVRLQDEGGRADNHRAQEQIDEQNPRGGHVPGSGPITGGRGTFPAVRQSRCNGSPSPGGWPPPRPGRRRRTRTSPGWRRPGWRTGWPSAG